MVAFAKAVWEVECKPAVQMYGVDEKGKKERIECKYPMGKAELALRGIGEFHIDETLRLKTKTEKWK